MCTHVTSPCALSCYISPVYENAQICNSAFLYTESLVIIRRSHSPAKENLKTDSTASGSGCREPDLKLPSQSEEEGYRLKGVSSSHKKLVSNGQETAVDGGKKKKKKAVGSRMKKIRKKYFCFIPF